MDRMSTAQVSEYRSVINRALYYAQYMRSVHGQGQYMSIVKHFILATELENGDVDLQPAVVDLFDYGQKIVTVKINEVSCTGTVKQLVDHCAAQYDASAKLINVWLDGQRKASAANFYQQNVK